MLICLLSSIMAFMCYHICLCAQVQFEINLARNSNIEYCCLCSVTKCGLVNNKCTNKQYLDELHTFLKTHLHILIRYLTCIYFTYLCNWFHLKPVDIPTDNHIEFFQFCYYRCTRILKKNPYKGHNLVRKNY